MTTATASVSTASIATTSFSTTSAHCDRHAHRTLRPDTECRTRAREFLTTLIGAPPDDLVWDDIHRLQGHAHLGGHELVVIASRDDVHVPVVLTASDWDQVRRDGRDRRALLSERAIADRRRLDAAFAH